MGSGDWRSTVGLWWDVETTESRFSLQGHGESRYRTIYPKRTLPKDERGPRSQKKDIGRRWEKPRCGHGAPRSRTEGGGSSKSVTWNTEGVSVLRQGDRTVEGVSSRYLFVDVSQTLRRTQTPRLLKTRECVWVWIRNCDATPKMTRRMDEDTGSEGEDTGPWHDVGTRDPQRAGRNLKSKEPKER